MTEILVICGVHRRDPLGEGRLLSGLVVEVFEIEGCYAKVVQDTVSFLIWDDEDVLNDRKIFSKSKKRGLGFETGCANGSRV